MVVTHEISDLKPIRESVSGFVSGFVKEFARLVVIVKLLPKVQ